MKHAAAIGLLVGGMALVGGCHTRTLEITSEPPGALVWLNDEQVGRTPLETDFVHYGTYDVRVRLDGYAPVSVHRAATASLADQPGVDFVSQAVPGRSVTRWNFVLESLPELTDRKGAENAAYERAKAFRDHVTGVKAPEPAAPATPVEPSPAPASPAAQPTGAAGTPTTVTPSPTSPSTTPPAPTTAN